MTSSKDRAGNNARLFLLHLEVDAFPAMGADDRVRIPIPFKQGGERDLQDVRDFLTLLH